MMMNKKKNNLIDALKKQGFEQKIVKAFEKVKREEFVPDAYKGLSYEDIALSIGEGQTISQPSTIAFMLSLLEVKNGNKVLEVGSGSGYVLALLSNMNPDGEVYGVERIKSLVKLSSDRLSKIKNVQVHSASQKLGLEKYAPFDRILVSASGDEIPQDLVKQLAPGGIMVIPVNESIIKFSEGIVEEHEGFVFVPLVRN